MLAEKFKGKFIVLDGPDGCGKSTQAKLLSDWLMVHGVNVEGYRDPGTTVIGEAIRKILLGTEYSGMGDNVEVMLYMAARAQLWKERIAAALSENKCVIMDRWISSTCAYQGHAGGFGIDKVIKIGNDCLDRVWPNITLILDVDRSISNSRMQRELDRMELKGDDYHQMVRQGYLELNRQMQTESPEITFKLIDATGDIQTVQQKVLDVINSL